MASFTSCEPNLTSSACDRTLPVWPFVAFPCDREGKRIADVIMGYLVDPCVKMVLYSEKDVILITDQYLGGGNSKVAHFAIAYFEQRECAALSLRHPDSLQSSASIQREYELGLRWNDKPGLVGALGYYEDAQHKILVTMSKFDATLRTFVEALRGRLCSLSSWKAIALGLFMGIKAMHSDGLAWPDLNYGNLLVKYKQEREELTNSSAKEVMESAICDYEKLRSVDSVNAAQCISDRRALLEIIQEVGTQTATISEEIREGKLILNIVKAHLGTDFPLDDTFLFERPKPEPFYDEA